MTFANPTYTSNELAHQIKDSRAACVFAHPDALLALRGALPPSFNANRRVVLTSRMSDIPTSLKAESWLLLDDLLAVTRNFEAVVIDGEDAVNTTALLYYSSGTTGKSKGVETTHYNITSAFEMSATNWRAISPATDVVLAVIPWYHITGGCVTMMYPIHVGELGMYHLCLAQPINCSFDRCTYCSPSSLRAQDVFGHYRTIPRHGHGGGPSHPHILPELSTCR